RTSPWQQTKPPRRYRWMKRVRRRSTNDTPWRGTRIVSIVSSGAYPSILLAAGTLKSASKETAMHVDGQCLCGALEYEAEVDPATAHICHCTDCQTLSGSAFRTTVYVTGGFRFLKGEPRTYVKIADSGNRRVLAFCPTCGTSVYSRPEDGKEGYFGLR